MGVGLERAAIRPVMRHALSLSWVLSTVAVSIVLKNAAVQLWGPEQVKFPSPFGETVVQSARPAFSRKNFSSSSPRSARSSLCNCFLRRSLFGKALIAVAFNRNAAAVMGINVRRMVVFAFVLSSALAGLGGILIAPITFAWAYMGTTPGIKAFAAAIFGGLDNPIGILIGGLVIGVLEQLFGVRQLKPQGRHHLFLHPHRTSNQADRSHGPTGDHQSLRCSYRSSPTLGLSIGYSLY